MHPAFKEPTIYRRDDSITSGPTLMIRQADDIMTSAAHAQNRKAVMDSIASRFTFKISYECKKLVYATDIDQTALYIKVHAASYITSCLTKLGWDTASKDSTILVPMIPPPVKDIAKSPGPLVPGDFPAIVTKFIFHYQIMTGMLIFAVNSRGFGIASELSILSKFNDRPGVVHF
jgi:hypothetical protein